MGSCPRDIILLEGEIGMKRFVIEFGYGIDLHGQDVNNAAAKAVKDAISHSCLSGLVEICGIKPTFRTLPCNGSIFFTK
jgi:hypothetical protein